MGAPMGNRNAAGSHLARNKKGKGKIKKPFTGMRGKKSYFKGQRLRWKE